MTAQRTRLTAIAASGLIALAACGGGGGDGGAGGDNGIPLSPFPACTDPPYFSVLPVDPASISGVAPIGTLNPPAHTVPNDHGGITVTENGVPLSSPGTLYIDRVRKLSFLLSDWRQGETDYVIDFHVCQSVRGIFGHVASLAAGLPVTFDPATCFTYETGDETVEACTADVSIEVEPGEPLGTVGGATAPGVDFGLYDERHLNTFVNPSRFYEETLTAICPYEYFTPAHKDYLLSHVGFPSGYRTDEPLCGTVAVDAAGTAQGVWVREDNQVVRPEDERPFLTLAYDSINPSTTQVFSVGPAELGTGHYSFPIADAGYVNRRFNEVTADGMVYCYEAFAGPHVLYVFLIALGSDGALMIEHLPTSPAYACQDLPGTWSFGGGMMRFVR